MSEETKEGFGIVNILKLIENFNNLMHKKLLSDLFEINPKLKKNKFQFVFNFFGKIKNE